MWTNNKVIIITLIAVIIPAVFASWILIHILAIFGIFIAISYPLWWLLAPKQTVCLLCRAEKDRNTCPLCRQQIRKSEGVSPRNLTSAVLNGVLILVFSLVSIGAVYGESQVLSYFGFTSTQKTASFVIPATKQHLMGEIFPMNIEIDNIKTPINAIQADIAFDPHRVEAVGISTDNSFATIFIQKTIDNKGGYVRLTGGIPNPGWYGTHGLFGIVYFEAKEPGLATISYLPSSMILANDGKGTDILEKMPSISYLILPDKISQNQQRTQQKLLSEKVLGASTSTTGQLDFSDETSVLGVNTEETTAKQNDFNIFVSFANDLGELDTFILNVIPHVAIR